MPARSIDALLELWTASLLKSENPPPFTDHKELYETIDQTPLGDVRWRHFNMTYGGEKPNNAPSWMDDTHTVQFRDPRAVIHNMLANPDFKDEIDYGPLHEFDHQGNRRLKNFMGGDWAWRQAVRLLDVALD